MYTARDVLQQQSREWARNVRSGRAKPTRKICFEQIWTKIIIHTKLVEDKDEDAMAKRLNENMLNAWQRWVTTADRIRIYQEFQSTMMSDEEKSVCTTKASKCCCKHTITLHCTLYAVRDTDKVYYLILLSISVYVRVARMQLTDRPLESDQQKLKAIYFLAPTPARRKTRRSRSAVDVELPMVAIVSDWNFCINIKSRSETTCRYLFLGYFQHG